MNQHTLSGGDYWELRARRGDAREAEWMTRQAMAVLEQARSAHQSCVARLGGVYGFDPALADYALDDVTLTLRDTATAEAATG
ncbi:MAG: hypothetical protein M3Q55_02610 [Acidobacteriota bacterium]|nr:hypothetical protein [Acidobacteriota bacterium]